jgi:MFS family permease
LIVPRSRHYLLAVLFAALVFNCVDAGALGLVLQDIKVELHLSDPQLGFLTGIAFALFYGTMGIPIARWADQGNRVTIISLTTAVWSVLFALCGSAANFFQLMLLRVGLGIGEAGCNAPAQSLVAEYFTRAERPRALAIYMTGGSFGVLIGFGLGGWLNQLYGWRIMFVLLGLPGIVVAALVRFTLKDPRFGRADTKAADSFEHRHPTAAGDSGPLRANQTTLRQVGRLLWSNTTVRHLLLFNATSVFFSSAAWVWQPTFLIRSYGLKTGELGAWLALIYGFGGMLGVYLGGALASRYAGNNERLQLKAAAITFGSAGIGASLIYLMPNHYLALGLMALSNTAGAAVCAPAWAVIMTLVDERMRASATAISAFFASLIGNGLGPLATGTLSDALEHLFGHDSLRYALLILCFGYLWPAWHLLVASKSVTRDLSTLCAPAIGTRESDAVSTLS